MNSIELCNKWKYSIAGRDNADSETTLIQWVHLLKDSLDKSACWLFWMIHSLKGPSRKSNLLLNQTTLTAPKRLDLFSLDWLKGTVHELDSTGTNESNKSVLLVNHTCIWHYGTFLFAWLMFSYKSLCLPCVKWLKIKASAKWYVHVHCISGLILTVYSSVVIRWFQYDPSDNGNCTEIKFRSLWKAHLA